ncbi:MAG: hypothetical protein JXA61_00295 [Bacteroidales bacterium]|nr:hypothetical protein [Bacteroidales bacterium]
MKTLVILCLLILLSSFRSIAQNDTLILERGTVYPGYIITLEGDTLEGWLLNINLWLNQQMTFFYDDPDNHDGRVKYMAEDLKGYKVGNREYESIKFMGLYSPRKNNFFMRTITGPISYYVWYYDPERSKLSSTDISLDDISDAILFEESELSNQNQDLFHKFDDEMVSLGQLKYLTNFDKNMSKIVSDYPGLAERIRNKEEGYKWINARDIIREYNTWYLEQADK